MSGISIKWHEVKVPRFSLHYLKDYYVGLYTSLKHDSQPANIIFVVVFYEVAQ